MSFTWESDTKRFRNDDTGRFVSEKKILKYVDLIEKHIAGDMKSLGESVASGDMSAGEFRIQFRQAVKETYLQTYMLGAGGRNAMTFADYGRVGRALRTQYKYGEKFIADIESGRYEDKPKALIARMNLYFNSATQAYHRARTESYGLPRMPAYPADGSTICMSNCKCRWRIEVIDAEAGIYHCYWDVSLAENCDTCKQRADSWSPIIVINGVIQDYASISRATSPNDKIQLQKLADYFKTIYLQEQH